MKLIIDVKVSDLDRAVTFYTKTLGLPCRIHEKDWAAILVGDLPAGQAGAEIHLYLEGGVTDSVEFYVDDIDAESKRLRNLGVEFISGENKPDAIKVDENNITEFPWGRIAYFKDSEGNELALVKDFE